MKKPSEMTVHELVEGLLNARDQIDDRTVTPSDKDDICDLLIEAAERLELAADGQGVGPTAIKSGL